MAARKTKAAVAPESTPPVVGRTSTSVPAGGIAIAPEQAAVLEGDIDSRMKALLKDHKDMGSR